MSNQILIKRTGTQSKVPATTDIALGELAVNTYDGKLFMKKNNGSDVMVEIGAVTTVAGRNGAVTLAVADIAGAAPITSPVFTGTPSAPTAAGSDNSTALATTAFVKTAVAGVSAGAVASAAKWTTARDLALTGDATGTLSAVDGTANVSAALTLATVNTNTGIYGSATTIPVLTINGKGLITAASSQTLSTSNVVEGSNLYFTSARASAAAPVQTVFGRTGAVVLASGDVTSALGFTPADNAKVGAVNGIATLDASGRLPVSQLTASVVGAVVYQGTWDASTNTPAFTSGVGTKGNYYKVSVTGTTTVDGKSQWNAGDVIIFNGTIWDKIDGIPSEVISVAGRTGAITLTTADVAEGTNLYFTNARASAAAPVQSVAGRTGAVVLAVADVSGAAPLASPALTGTPTAPTAVTSDNSTIVATTAFVKAQNYITSAGAPVQSVAGRTGAVVLTIADISGTIDGGSF
jgi:hypothetical protein